MVLEMLAPLCKREKSGIHSHGSFLLEAPVPALDGSVDRISTEAFLPCSDLVCPLLMQASYSSLLVLSLRRGGDTAGVDLMAPQIDLVPYHKHLCLICPFLWYHPRWSRVAFWNVSQARPTGEASILPVPVQFPEYSPNPSRNGESQRDEQQPRCPFWVSPRQYMW